MAREKADISGEEKTSNLPPPLRKRLRKILTDHSHAIIHDRASVVRERRGDGRPYWRLYLESGSAQERERKRVYIGPEGGPELRQAIRQARQDYWLGCESLSDFLRALSKILENEARQIREARDAARNMRAAALALGCRYRQGRG